jgi:hypothetical protein
MGAFVSALEKGIFALKVNRRYYPGTDMRKRLDDDSFLVDYLAWMMDKTLNFVNQLSSITENARWPI